MDPPNHVSDFEPDRFTFYADCKRCEHAAPVDHRGLDLTMPELQSRLRCSQCGSRDCSIRISFTGYEALSYRRHDPPKAL